MVILQNLLFNNNLSNISEKLYFDVQKGSVTLDQKHKGLIFAKGSSVSFGAYFNYFSLNTWHRYCQLDNLFFQLKGKGEFILIFYHATLENKSEIIFQKQIILNKDKRNIDIELPYTENKEGILYFTITAIQQCYIESGCFYTITKPVNIVKLGIVITHYNRKHYLIPAIKRIKEQLLSNDIYKPFVDLIVVDNSQNVLPEEAEGAVVIPNENYGGSGGFTRGLLYLKDHHYTHCLFMDDDASCEIESIIKTLRLLQYSITPQLAIAGMMLYQENSTIIHEKGALYKPLSLIQLHYGLDMSKFGYLLETDLDIKKPEYGAWWHFAFKIDEISYYPFPFFVKGDDMLFSLVNNFNIITVNGISVFGEDFRYKDGPLPRYLSVRANFILALIHSDCPLWIYLWRYIRWILISILTYRYASARATSVALQHVMQGPKFWLENMSFVDIASHISDLLQEEKMEIIDLAELKPKILPVSFVHLKKIFIILTFNGFLLPSFFIKDTLVLSKKMIRHFPYQIFRQKRVLYYSSEYKTGYIAIYDKKRFFKELLLSFKLIIQFVLKFKMLKKQYKQKAPEIMSENFWRDIYKI